LTVFDEWDRIAARIKGLSSATSALWEGITVNPNSGGDYHGLTGKWLIPSAKELIEEIDEFRKAQGSELEPAALAALDSGLTRLQQYAKRGSGGIPLTITLVAGLLALESELSFHIHDFDASARPSVERAFLHLQRSLVVDQDMRKRWEGAFQSGEEACEKLGAVHLLLHGIYAFKTDAKGERTDLVLGHRLSVDDALRRSANALVLTEWKVAKPDSEAPSRFSQALTQAKRYSSGHLAGFELHRYRYLVLVTKDAVSIPRDEIDGDFTYRRINIAISPSSPSRTKVPSSGTT
jgi:hypothetical protein